MAARPSPRTGYTRRTDCGQGDGGVDGARRRALNRATARRARHHAGQCLIRRRARQRKAVAGRNAQGDAGSVNRRGDKRKCHGDACERSAGSGDERSDHVNSCKANVAIR